MDRRAWILGLSLSFLGACNWVDGACWLKKDDNAGTGAGGAPIVPAGGSFGDAPEPTPQGAGDPPPPPECLQVPQGECFQKCLADYEAAAAKCGEIANDAQRLSCQNAAYNVYNTCRSNCQEQQNKCIENWQAGCDKEHDACHADCTKNDPTSSCHNQCNQVYGSCLKDCKNRCK